jgi:ribosomal 30S subunit maturation factor RimM
MNYANHGEYQMLGEMLKNSQSLLFIDLSSNSQLDDNEEYHKEIIDCLVNSPGSKLKKIKITTGSTEVMGDYIELKDQRPGLLVYNNGKILQDVDLQERD